MKKILIAVGCLLQAAAFAQKTTPVADTLEYLYSISNNSFDALQPRHDNNYELLPLHILGADEVTLINKGVFGYELWLEYHRGNSQANAVLKGIQKFMKKKEAEKDWAFQHFTDIDPTTLTYKRMRVFSYSVFEPGAANSLTMRIVQTTPNIPALADEVYYKGKYPATKNAGTGPQIIQVTGTGSTPGSYIRFNGVFGPTGLQSGKVSLHGYGEFYEGDFISQNFHPADKGRVNAIFIPANTHDTIYGQLLDSSMREFDADTRYSGYVKNKWYSILPDAPHWVSVSDDWRMALYAAYKREHEEAASQSYTPDTHVYNNSNDHTASRAGRSPCSCCSGRGYNIVYTNTEYQKKDQYGSNQGIGTHYINVSCSCCGGSGWR